MRVDLYKLLHDLDYGRAKFLDAVLYLFYFGYVRLYLVMLFLLNSLSWLLAYYVNKHVSQTLVVLHYNVNLGVNLIGNASDIYLIPTLGLAFIIINFLLLLNICRQGKFLIHLLLGFSLLINLFLIASTITIYFINFR